MTTGLQKQVKLPANVAMGVVLQGIRIRFGRSLVTIFGVALGIAFLMATFTGQSLRQGVSDEVDLRQTIDRMDGFLVAEMGPIPDRIVDIIQVGELSRIEQRFITRIRRQRPAEIRWFGIGEASPPSNVQTKVVDVDEVGRGASAIVIVGQSEAMSSLPWAEITARMRQPVIAKSRSDLPVAQVDGRPVVELERRLHEEERTRIEAENRKAKLRAMWIVAISLLVTVIGIANSMLMSVTERFREIGTMKCLGALSAFIRQLFLLESSLIGGIGAVAGAVFGMLFSIVVYSITFGTGLVVDAIQVPAMIGYLAISVTLGVLLSIIAAIYPAHVASRMVPASALRSTI